MNHLEEDLLKYKKVNEIYHFIGHTFSKHIKTAILIITQIDEKFDKSHVINVYGKNIKWPLKLLKLAGISPIGKNFDIPEEGRKHYYHSNKFKKHHGRLFEFAGGHLPGWVCRTLEFLFSIKAIYTIGLSYNSYPIASVMVLKQKNEDFPKFYELENLVPVCSKRLYDIITENKVQLKIPQLKDDFTRTLIRNISHEIRTPLNAILGLIQAQGDKNVLKEMDPEILENIWSSARQLTQVIENMITISELETNSAEFVFKQEKISLMVGIVERCIHNVTYSGTNRKIYFLHTDVPENYYVFIDEKRIENVISELIDNALKFSDFNVEVSLDITEKLNIKVKDCGIGISKENQTHIFENFVQLKSPDHMYRGTGIGLSIARQIIQNHHGKLYVDSFIGLGSTFTIEIPIYNIN